MKISKFLAVAAIAMTVVSCNTQVKSVSSLETELDSVSYALGLNLGSQLKANFDDVNRDVYIQGFLNGLDSVNLLVSPKEIQGILNPFFQKKQQEKIAEQAEKQFGEYRKQNEQFIADNKAKEGVKTTASGLQYIVLEEGKGETPAATDTVSIHYKGSNIDGVEFDSSYKRGKPYESKANQFVPGFSEGLQLMKAGSKYKFFIPQDLGYGAQQRGKDIKPFSALVFEVELLEVKK